MTQFEYKNHQVIIRKQRNLPKYNITIIHSETRKIIKQMDGLESTLRKAKSRAKDYIGL